MKQAKKKIAVWIRATFVGTLGVFVALLLTGFITVGEVSISSEGLTQEDVGSLDLDDLMQRVLILNQQNQHQKAIELLSASISSQKENTMLKALLVQTFDLFLEDEIRSGQRAIIKNPRDASAYARVSNALELMGDNFRALEILTRGVSMSPKAEDLWMSIGKLELKAGRYFEAMDVFKEVIRINPKNSDAYNNVAFVIAQSDKLRVGDLQEAETYAKKARAMEPNNPDYLDTLAEVQFKKGNRKLAQSLIEEAIKLAPEQQDLQMQLRRFRNDSGFEAK